MLRKTNPECTVRPPRSLKHRHGIVSMTRRDVSAKRTALQETLRRGVPATNSLGERREQTRKVEENGAKILGPCFLKKRAYTGNGLGRAAKFTVERETYGIKAICSCLICKTCLATHDRPKEAVAVAKSAVPNGPYSAARGDITRR